MVAVVEARPKHNLNGGYCYSDSRRDYHVYWFNILSSQESTPEVKQTYKKNGRDISCSAENKPYIGF